jgi:hypothetical protein
MSELLFERAREEHQAFLTAVGDLTLAWADVETVLFRLLKHYSGVTWPVAQALFSGTRARQAMAFIDAIAENVALEDERKQDLQEVFAQIKAINTLRDFVVHNVDGSEQEFEDEDPTTRYVSDSLRASRRTKTRTYLVGSATLVAMRDDCVECCWRLHPHLDPNNSPFQPGSGRDKREPWKFKSPSTVERDSHRR